MGTLVVCECVSLLLSFENQLEIYTFSMEAMAPCWVVSLSDCQQDVFNPLGLEPKNN